MWSMMRWMTVFMIVGVLVSCEKEAFLDDNLGVVKLKSIDDCGLYYSHWSQANGNTILYKLDTSVEGKVTYTAVSDEINGSFHISLDANGVMYLVDQLSGDLYEWDISSGEAAPGDKIVDGDDWYMYAGTRHFTQNVVCEFGNGKVIFIGDMNSQKIFAINITDGSLSYGEVLAEIDDCSISGGDIAVTPDDVATLFVFSKDGSTLYEVDLVPYGIVTENHGVSTVNGAAYYDEEMWVASDEKLVQYDLSSGIKTDLELIGAPDFVYGDLGSCAPTWGGTTVYEIPIPKTTEACFEVNPGEAKQNTLFELWDGGMEALLTGDDLNELNKEEFEGPADSVIVTPHKKVTVNVNGDDMELLTNTSYTFVGDLQVHLFNTAPGGENGQAKGQWSICITSQSEIEFSADHHGNGK